MPHWVAYTTPKIKCIEQRSATHFVCHVVHDGHGTLAGKSNYVHSTFQFRFHHCFIQVKYHFVMHITLNIHFCDTILDTNMVTIVIIEHREFYISRYENIKDMCCSHVHCTVCTKYSSLPHRIDTSTHSIYKPYSTRHAHIQYVYL